MSENGVLAASFDFKVFEAKDFCESLGVEGGGGGGEGGGETEQGDSGGQGAETTSAETECESSWSKERDCTSLDRLKVADNEALCTCMDLIPVADAEALLCKFSPVFDLTVRL